MHYLNASPQFAALVTKMLTKDFHSRPGIKKVLGDSWFTSALGADDDIDRSAVKALSGVKRKSDMHQALMADMASRENLAQMQEVNQLFAALDKDNDGHVSADEARDGLRKLMSASDVENLINELIGDDGTIPYTEFMGQMIDIVKAEETDFLWRIFQDADSDDSGYLDRRELRDLMQRPEVAKCLGQQDINQLMDDMDDDGSGRIEFEEFRRVVEGEEPNKAGYSVGDKAEYYSTTHSCWIPCKIEDVDYKSGSVIISVKPGCWIPKAQFPGKLQPPQGAGSGAKAAGIGKQLLAGGLGF
jgi:Ca2+-binding EF-hand superfamily protein